MVDLPREIQVSSQIRHNIIMAVKEAVHNVLKHAKASAVTIRMAFDGRQVTVEVQDDGSGFDPATVQAGHGLVNMKRRLEDIGGQCAIESKTGHGTTVRMRLVLSSPEKSVARN